MDVQKLEVDLKDDKSKLQFELHGLKSKLAKVVVKVKLAKSNFSFWYLAGLSIVSFMRVLISFVGIFYKWQGIRSVERAIILNESKEKDPARKKLTLLVEG